MMLDEREFNNDFFGFALAAGIPYGFSMWYGKKSPILSKSVILTALFGLCNVNLVPASVKWGACFAANLLSPECIYDSEKQQIDGRGFSGTFLGIIAGLAGGIFGSYPVAYLSSVAVSALSTKVMLHKDG